MDKTQEQLNTVVEEIKSTVTDSVKAEMQATVPAITDEVFKRFKDELPNRKGIFSADNGESEKSKELAGKEKMAELIKATYNRDGAQVKALSEGTAADGGYVSPEVFGSEIIRLAPNYGVIRRNARNYPVPGAGYKTHLPTVSGISVSRVNEGAAIGAVKPTFGQTNITIKKVAAIIPMSNELLKDANVDVVNLLSTLTAEAFAKYEDEWGFLGKNSGEGIFQNTSVPALTLGSTNTTYAKVTADDLLSALEKLDESALPGAKWYMSFSVFNVLRKLKATTNEYLVQTPTGGQPATIWNMPIELVRVMPKTSAGSQQGTNFIAVGDLSYMLFADKKQYSFEVSDQATITDTDGSTAINLWQQDMSAVRVIERVDIQLAEPDKAFAIVKTAAS